MQFIPYFICLALLASSLTAAANNEQAADEDWQFKIAPYLWATSIDAKAGLQGTPPQEVDISVSDVIDNLEMALLINFRAQKGQWGVAIDTVYMDLRGSNRFGPLDSKLTADVQQLLVSPSVFFQPRHIEGLELLIGARHADLDNTISIKGPLCSTLGRPCKVSDGDDWFEAFVGARYSYDVNDRFSLFGYGDLGGFSGQSDSMYQFMLGAEYKFSDTLKLSAGYRVFDVDYESSGFAYDAKTEGLIAGIGFIF